MCTYSHCLCISVSSCHWWASSPRPQTSHWHFDRVRRLFHSKYLIFQPSSAPSRMSPSDRTQLCVVCWTIGNSPFLSRSAEYLMGCPCWRCIDNTNRRILIQSKRQWPDWLRRQSPWSDDWHLLSNKILMYIARCSGVQSRGYRARTSTWHMPCMIFV